MIIVVITAGVHDHGGVGDGGRAARDLARQPAEAACPAGCITTNQNHLQEDFFQAAKAHAANYIYEKLTDLN